MATIYDSKGIKKKVRLQAYYNLDGDYILFPENPLHGKTFRNVGVVIKEEVHSVCSIAFREQVVYLTNSNEEPIGCELVDVTEYDNELVIGICQDWG